MSTTQERAVGATAEARLLAIVAELSAELRATGEEQPSIRLDSALDRELDRYGDSTGSTRW